jgi:hypothetical protein
LIKFDAKLTLFLLLLNRFLQLNFSKKVKQFFFIMCLIFFHQSFAQQLIYKPNGNILNSENQKIQPDQVRELLANNQQLLDKYNAGRSKQTAGNIMMYGGLGLAIGGFAYETNKANNSTFGTYDGNQYLKSIIGGVIIIISIPIKIGFSKKIKSVVSDYNNGLKVSNNDFKIQKTEFITNQNGIGVRLVIN